MALESKYLFMTGGTSDQGSIPSSSANAAGFGVENLQKTEMSDRWRSTTVSTASPAYFEMDLGSDYSLDFFFLNGHNSLSTTEWRIRLDATQGGLTGGSPAYDSGWISIWESNAAMAAASKDLSGYQKKSSFHDAGTNLKRWIRVDIRDDNLTYFEAARFMAGQKFQPTMNMEYGSGIPWPTESSVNIALKGGGVRRVPMPRPRRVSVSLQFDTEAELMDNLYEFTRTQGVSSDILFIWDPTSVYAHEGTLYSNLVDTGNTSIPAFEDWKMSLELMEKI